VPKERGDLDVGLADGTGDAAYQARLDEALERVWAFEPSWCSTRPAPIRSTRICWAGSR
jgi:hypothetical protein